MIKIDNENELMTFLKILSEEAVISSRAKLRETSDNLSNSFKDRLDSEKKELYEEEEGQAEEENVDASSGEDADQSLQSPAEDSIEEEEPEPEKSEEEPEGNEELKASLDALERFINALRAGKSLRDSTVQDQVENYFDRLDGEEKTLMVLFVRELSKILAGDLSGNAAVNPNEDPYNLDVVQMSSSKNKPDDEAVDEPEASSSPEEDNKTKTANFFDEEEEEPEEDTSPPVPIKVGTQQQGLNELRKKIKKLMSA